ncbi:sn-glycerol-3-phosphate transport system permease protein UgpE [Vreelandella aquamarina]|jgi:multiple sugar transport system permease protein|uniref:Sn-glycerol-3-phosphate transport system permease protein UgpE n=1 Tax=Vreelandella aquamarina TaxID=77097 RepID=A0A6F8XFG4_9GAMM|nr:MULTISPECIES: carbohydrate ABC transporter permease [Halomonas]PHR88658.1 MAG: carbohydrate ABC transporter permease [Leeuwenhoekiella sp.]BCA92661.1 sn-glycerol-3-phosphate transport system permease protein UgpE [Halomonas meridiana]BCB72494.1 sn-glycerol-3-phosphate transport system permease protein UgpE [Halomonas meridiana]|tara:strand:+ start:1352 stop:2197 length:846 start_codon:yes stop_codon:yes gene_type:complete
MGRLQPTLKRWYPELLRHAFLIMLAAVMVMPFIWMVLTSFKPANEIFSNEINWLPGHWALIENYTRALTNTSLIRYMGNGLLVVVAILILQFLVSIPAAYALAKLSFPGRFAMFICVLACLMIPAQAVAIPWYLQLHYVGILDSYWALILPFTLSVFGIFLLRQFFIGIPDDLIDAARMDGMNEFRIIWSVVVPNSIPALISFGIFSVIAHWNDYFWPLIVLNDQDYYTPTLGVVDFRNAESGSDYGALMAAATIVVLPLLVAFLLAQRRFIEGISTAGMK